jgi:transcriptional regulator with XRE-family HTH domain
VSEKVIHTFNDRLKELINLLKLSGNAFAKKLNVSPSAINTVIGPRQSKPSTDLLEKIGEAYPRVNMDWLIIGRGEPLRPLGERETIGSQANEDRSAYNSRVQHQSGNNNIQIIGELESCRQKVALLERVVEGKDQIITLLKERK